MLCERVFKCLFIMNTLNPRKVILLSFFLTGLVVAVDLDGDLLDDLWQQEYSAINLTASGDEDSDGYTNAQESEAGTDPFSSLSLPSMRIDFEDTTDSFLKLSFDTQKGKMYDPLFSTDLEHFINFSSCISGDGSTHEFEINKLDMSTKRSAVMGSFWANIEGDVADLTSHPNFSTADGLVMLSSPEAPSYLATGYGAKISFKIFAPDTGDYKFYLSSGGAAELYVSTTSSSDDLVKVAELLSTQKEVEAGEWTEYETQASDNMALVSGQIYCIEVLYVGQVPNQHVHVGWLRPGSSNIEQITEESLADEPLHAEYLPDAEILFARDYDQGESALFVENNIVTGVTGMKGNAEKLTAAASSLELGRYQFDPEGTTDHLYASCLFNMDANHSEAVIVFMEGETYTKEGPRVDFGVNATGLYVEGGGNGAGSQKIYVDPGETYRIEIVATISDTGFIYSNKDGEKALAADRFDFYITKLDGSLVGYATDLTFRDSAENNLSFISNIDFRYTDATPSIAFDDWLITSGLTSANGYLLSNGVNFDQDNVQDGKQFYRIRISDKDQDGDGISDSHEQRLAEHRNLLFFDPMTNNVDQDMDMVTAMLDPSPSPSEFSLYATDAAAFENNYPSLTRDDAEIVVSRTGSIAPITVKLCVAPLMDTGNTTTVCDGTCCTLVGSAGDEAVELEDYELYDENGNLITDTLEFELGEMSKTLTVIAVNDNINEYPETLNLAVDTSEDGSYTLSETLNGASIQLFDLQDHTANVTIFTGAFSQDDAATMSTSGSGFVTAVINGPRTEMRIWSQFNNLNEFTDGGGNIIDPQIDSHVHKSGIGNSIGAIIYTINETPGDAATDPFNGQLQYWPEQVLSIDSTPDGVSTGAGYPWDLTQSSGATSTSGLTTSKQVIIDSLFGQNGETPLYFNIHTTNNPAGEIWAFLEVSGGSVEDPGDPLPAAAPNSNDYPQLYGYMLEVEVRRFLNQATFGSTDADVEALVSKIETERASDATYHRNTAYLEWIEEQMDPTVYDQTYAIDYYLASIFQAYAVGGLFNPEIALPTVVAGETYPTPTRPASFPTTNRTNANPELWYLQDPYPISAEDARVGWDNRIRSTHKTGRIQEFHSTMWQLWSKANDQLRQKMGAALQQIVVISNYGPDANAGAAQGMANYHDMLSTYAFSHYRDVLGFVNRSPAMASYLSSLYNQKAIDIDGDGIYDSFPDENLARENMQLFSIGLFQRWPDGTLKLSEEGLPQPTYTNDDIKEFAKVITGHGFSRVSNGEWGGVEIIPENTDFYGNGGAVLDDSYIYPVTMFSDFHADGIKSFAGTTINNLGIADPQARAEADVESAIDWLAGKPGDGQPDYDMVNSHGTTPAFISNLLIQRFTTSNPSREYLHRVATAFKDSEGNLGETIKAILLDPEVRNVDLENTVFGMKTSPMEGYIQLMRTMDAHTMVPLTDPTGDSKYANSSADYSNPDLYFENFGYNADQLDNFTTNSRILENTATSSGSAGLQMTPYNQITVFNYYLPDFSPSSEFSQRGLVAPEMQLANEGDLIRNVNYFNSLIRTDSGNDGYHLGGYNARQGEALGGTNNAADNTILSRDIITSEVYPDIQPVSGNTSHTSFPNPVGDQWVRIERTGDFFVTSRSSDGVNWIVMDTQVIPMTEMLYVGLAATSHSVGNIGVSTFDNVTVVNGTTHNWADTTIGNDPTATSSSESNGVITIESAGADIWNQADEFHFRYRRLEGDGSITARVTNISGTHDWAKAGVIMRSDLSDNSENVFIAASYANGITSQSRSEKSDERTAESVADEAMLDALDMQLTNGLFKLKYPIDSSDDGVDGEGMNPREAILTHITNAFDDPFDGTNDDEDRRMKMEDAMYLLTTRAEFQVKK